MFRKKFFLILASFLVLSLILPMFSQPPAKAAAQSETIPGTRLKVKEIDHFIKSNEERIECYKKLKGLIEESVGRTDVDYTMEETNKAVEHLVLNLAAGEPITAVPTRVYYWYTKGEPLEKTPFDASVTIAKWLVGVAFPPAGYVITLGDLTADTYEVLKKGYEEQGEIFRGSILAEAGFNLRNAWNNDSAPFGIYNAETKDEGYLIDIIELLREENKILEKLNKRQPPIKKYITRLKEELDILNHIEWGAPYRFSTDAYKLVDETYFQKTRDRDKRDRDKAIHDALDTIKYWEALLKQLYLFAYFHRIEVIGKLLLVCSGYDLHVEQPIGITSTDTKWAEHCYYPGASSGLPTIGLGDEVKVKATVTNIGNETANNVGVYFRAYEGEPEIKHYKVAPERRKNIGSLKPQESKTVEFNWNTIVTPFAAGRDYIREKGFLRVIIQVGASTGTPTIKSDLDRYHRSDNTAEMPVIVSYMLVVREFSPVALPVRVDEGGSLTFSVVDASAISRQEELDYPDLPRAELSYSWYLDEELVPCEESEWTYKPTYEDADQHEVKVRISDGYSEAILKWKVLVRNMNRAPEVKITADKEKAKIGEIIHLNALDSRDPDGDELSYSWDLDEDRSPDTEGSTASVAYEKGGEHYVTLFVSDGFGSQSGRIGIHVNKPPVACTSRDFKWAPVTGIIPFDASKSYDTDGEIVSYHWNFGDGSESIKVAPRHSYSEAGCYLVALTVKDDKGATGKCTVDVIVGEANFYLNPWHTHTMAYRGAPVTFRLSAAATGFPGKEALVSLDIDLPDGWSATLPLLVELKNVPPYELYKGMKDITFNVTVPHEAEQGKPYRFQVTGECHGLTKTLNYSIKVLKDPMPNLDVRDLGSAPATPTVDDDIWIEATIENLGVDWRYLPRPSPTDAHNIKVDFYDLCYGNSGKSSAKIPLDAQDRVETFIGSQTIKHLPGQHSIKVVMPWTFKLPGWHRIKVDVDPDNSIREYAELDNIRYSDDIYVRTKPDLKVSDARIVGPCRKSPDCIKHFKWTIYGLQKTATYESIFEPPKSEPWPSNVPVTDLERWREWCGWNDISLEEIELPVGGRHSVKKGDPKVGWKLVKTGETTMNLVLPTRGMVIEENSNATIWVRVQNLGETDAFNATVRVFVDGVPVQQARIPTILTRKEGKSYLSVPMGSYSPGKPMNITGIAKAGGFIPQGDGGVLIIRGKPAGVIDVHGVAYDVYRPWPAGEWTLQRSPPRVLLRYTIADWAARAYLEIPWVVCEAGEHEIKVVLDAENSIEESDETNNEATFKFYVGRKPDLRVKPENITLKPEKPFEAQSVALTAQVGNLGDTAASNVTVNFYEVNLETGNENMFYSAVTCIPGRTKEGEPGVSYISTEWTAKDGYGIKVSVDVDDIYEERDETNNEALVPVGFSRTKSKISKKVFPVGGTRDIDVFFSPAVYGKEVEAVKLLLTHVPMLNFKVIDKKTVDDSYVFTLRCNVDEDASEGWVPIKARLKSGSELTPLHEHKIFLFQMPGFLPGPWDNDGKVTDEEILKVVASWARGKLTDEDMRRYVNLWVRTLIISER